jgi:beta-glucanase (GH16 family)
MAAAVNERGQGSDLMRLLALAALFALLHPASSGTVPKPNGPGGNWNAIFADDFSGVSVDQSKWSTCLWWGCTGAQGQTNVRHIAQNVTVAGGTLTLTARQTAGSDAQGSYSYTLGEIQSGRTSSDLSKPPRFSMLYGFVEARVRAAGTRGFESGLWMSPADESWPPELDIAEILGKSSNMVNMAFHWRNASAGNNQDYTQYVGPDFAADWHTFGVDWEPTYITWYVDGMARKTYTDSNTIPHAAMDVRANVDVGGPWIGDPDSTTSWPGKFDIDYIRAWQKS